MELNNKIDVVVPIYNAYDALINCLNSLESHQKDINQVLLINDASTDCRINTLIEKYASVNNWHIINNENNLGFVATANIGLKQNNNHTILLNSDTVVSKNWIKAFRQVVESVSQLGTATAWSNNAEICSFPYFLTKNKQLIKIDQLSTILYKKYKPHYPKIPTAVGFCMLISKLAKEKVGYFDEKHFGHGYGEENDYSLRVKKAGLNNVLCDNAYVEHVGNESFSDLGLQPNEATMTRLLEKHPDYLNTIHKYINKDPLTHIRKEILAIIVKEDRDLYNELINE